jgi:formylglycine-generating enzyme required for sulfatase activity
MKHLTSLSSILLAAALFADPADPQISNVRLAQNSISRRVTVQYDLDEAAVVTMDVLTNGVSIGGANIQNVGGDCFKKVAAGNNHVVTWDPYLSWPDQKFGAGVVSVRMTAWALDNTPDYMVVDLAAANTVRYYPGVDFLPGSTPGQKGAVTNNPAYKTSKLIMRKIMASGVEWTMGSAAGETQRQSVETPHVVTLTNNYYIGVFEVTQAQWKNITPTSTATPQFTADAEMRPVEKVSYNEIRNSASKTANTAYNWPANPNASSFLGLLRTKTGLDFDLPTEAQWEFAARAGHGSGFWGDGSTIKNTDTDANLSNLARYLHNHGGTSTTPTLAPSVGGTAIVGSHKPNSWGLYDMHGNVWECCLDWYADNITTFDGKVNINPSNSAQTLSGATGSSRVRRGGSWYHPAGNCRPAHRISAAPDGQNADAGFRVVCTAGLQ